MVEKLLQMNSNYYEVQNGKTWSCFNRRHNVLNCEIKKEISRLVKLIFC